ncbi:hypothetical protein PR048_033320 [Dryococelus australis]|uniref:Uncharacterized protein n=1 Tax=Dryococelus australis TaxID=614101 RepID=A0ABQ9G3A6_9NEOP|nr:hypothetical protein PR048_033320 [Dryococelus australis]
MIGKFREFNDLYAKHLNPVYSRTSALLTLKHAEYLQVGGLPLRASPKRRKHLTSRREYGLETKRMIKPVSFEPVLIPRDHLHEEGGSHCLRSTYVNNLGSDMPISRYFASADLTPRSCISVRPLPLADNLSDTYQGCFEPTVKAQQLVNQSPVKRSHVLMTPYERKCPMKSRVALNCQQSSRAENKHSLPRLPTPADPVNPSLEESSARPQNELSSPRLNFVDNPYSPPLRNHLLPSSSPRQPLSPPPMRSTHEPVFPASPRSLPYRAPKFLRTTISAPPCSRNRASFPEDGQFNLANPNVGRKQRPPTDAANTKPHSSCPDGRTHSLQFARAGNRAPLAFSRRTYYQELISGAAAGSSWSLSLPPVIPLFRHACCLLYLPALLPPSPFLLHLFTSSQLHGTLNYSEEFNILSRRPRPKYEERIMAGSQLKSSVVIKGRGKREIPEKTRRPAASSGTITTCENTATRPGIGIRKEFRRVAVFDQTRRCVSINIRPGELQSGRQITSVVYDLSLPLPDKRLKQIHQWLEGGASWRIAEPAFTTEKVSIQRRKSVGYGVAERLDRSPPTRANRVKSPAGSPLLPVGEFSRGSPVSPAPSFRRCSIRTSLPSSSAPKTSMLRAAQISSLPRRRGSINGDIVTRIKSPIASKRKALNWRAVFSSCCVYLSDFQWRPYYFIGGNSMHAPRLVLCGSDTYILRHSALRKLFLAILACSEIVFLINLRSPPRHSNACRDKPNRTRATSCPRVVDVLGYRRKNVLGIALASLIATLGPKNFLRFGRLSTSRSLTADVGGARCEWISAGTPGQGKREIPEKTRPPAASSSTFPACVYPGATPPRFEPGPPKWEASGVTTTSPRPLRINVHTTAEVEPPTERLARRGEEMKYVGTRDAKTGGRAGSAMSSAINHAMAEGRRMFAHAPWKQFRKYFQ